MDQRAPCAKSRLSDTRLLSCGGSRYEPETQSNEPVRRARRRRYGVRPRTGGRGEAAPGRAVEEFDQAYAEISAAIGRELSARLWTELVAPRLEAILEMADGEHMSTIRVVERRWHPGPPEKPGQPPNPSRPGKPVVQGRIV